MKQRPILIATALATSLILTGCTGGGTPTPAEPTVSADLAERIAAVTAEELQGTTLKVADYHGQCPEATDGVTDPSKGTNQCDTFAARDLG